MKHSITIQTEEHSDVAELISMLQIDRYKSFLDDFKNEIRTLVKHSPTEADSAFGERLHEMFYRLLGDNGLTLD